MLQQNNCNIDDFELFDKTFDIEYLRKNINECPGAYKDKKTDKPTLTMSDIFDKKICISDKFKQKISKLIWC